MLHPLVACSDARSLGCFLGNHSTLEQFQQLQLPKFSPFLFLHVESVEEGVERRVDRQHEDRHSHADLASDGNTGRRQQTHHTDRKPAEKVGHDDGDETTGDDDVLRLPACIRHHEVGLDGKVDDALARSDEKVEDEVEDGDHREGVPLSVERLSGDGQRNADAVLAVILPV